MFYSSLTTALNGISATNYEYDLCACVTGCETWHCQILPKFNNQSNQSFPEWYNYALIKKIKGSGEYNPNFYEYDRLIMYW